jgi:hypothetical protein
MQDQNKMFLTAASLLDDCNGEGFDALLDAIAELLITEDERDATRRLLESMQSAADDLM